MEQKHTLVRAFLGHWPITKVDLHLDHVLEHVLFSRLRKAKTPLCSPLTQSWPLLRCWMPGGGGILSPCLHTRLTLSSSRAWKMVLLNVMLSPALHPTPARSELDPPDSTPDIPGTITTIPHVQPAPIWPNFIIKRKVYRTSVVSWATRPLLPPPP